MPSELIKLGRIPSADFAECDLETHSDLLKLNEIQWNEIYCGSLNSYTSLF